MRHPLHLVILSALTLAPLAAESPPVRVGEDLVILSNRHRITGYLLAETEHEVTIRTAGGTLRIPAHLVARTEPGFQRRLDALAADDHDGHLRLARWCLARDRRDDALTVLKAIRAHPAITPTTLALLARLTDEIDGAEAALPIYRAWRDAGGDDPETRERLAQLEAVAAENASKQQAYERELAARTVKEGLESTRRWTPEDPKWANPVRARVVEAPQSDGDRVLRLSFDGAADDRHRKAAIRWREQLDVRGSNVLYFEVSNVSDRALPISIAVKSGEDWAYYESTTQNVAGDGRWQALEFDLTAPIYKCAEDDYRSHAYRVAATDDIREIQIQVHNGTRDGHLFLNNLGFLSK